MKTRLVIFDMDGTLLDTLQDLSNTMNHVLQNHNFPTHKTEEYRYMVGNGIGKLDTAGFA